MKLLLFGATGMIGQAVLREALQAPDVEQILCVGRSATGQRAPKLRERLHADFTRFEALTAEAEGFDACAWCLGVSSAGMREAEYRRVTYDYTLAAARTLVKANPGMIFEYVSGQGTDSSERGRSMWARVKGETENALLALPFRGVYLFRPGFIQPAEGIRSRTPLYRWLYAALSPVYPALRRVAPRHLTTSGELGRAMLQVARHGAPKHVLETPDINAIASSTGPGSV